jgi:hypothetical protein
MESTKVPADFLRQSFQTWIHDKDNLEGFMFSFDDDACCCCCCSSYIQFQQVYQVYESHLSITYDGSHAEDLLETFRQLDEIKLELLDDLKAIQIDSISFNSDKFVHGTKKLLNRRLKLYCYNRIVSITWIWPPIITTHNTKT